MRVDLATQISHAVIIVHKKVKMLIVMINKGYQQYSF